MTLASAVVEVMVAVAALAESRFVVTFCGVVTGGVDRNLLEPDRPTYMQGQLRTVIHHVSFVIPR